MRIVRLQTTQGPGYGVVEGEDVYTLQGEVFGHFETGPRMVALEDAHILPPCTPSKIVAIGRNYAEHIHEMAHDIPDEPIIFLKPPSAVIGHLDAIVYPAMSQRVDHEGELAVIIGRPCHLVEPGQARQYILGYTCANDVTARDLQRKDSQWTRGKGFDTFLPLGPFIFTGVDLQHGRIETRVNGQVKQSAQFGDMLFGVDHLISFVSQVMTLRPGDVLLTGTPAGVGPLDPGDVVEVEIAGGGVLRNHVTAPKR